MKRDIVLYLQDINISINKIERYIRGLSFVKFKKDSKTQDAVIRNLEIIGEAAKNIPKDVKNRFSDIPWKQIITMRNKVIHEYFGVDTEILWQTVKEDIPALKLKIKRL